MKLASGPDYIKREQHGKNLEELALMRQAGLTRRGGAARRDRRAAPSSAASTTSTGGSRPATSSTPSSSTRIPATCRRSVEPGRGHRRLQGGRGGRAARSGSPSAVGADGLQRRTAAEPASRTSSCAGSASASAACRRSRTSTSRSSAARSTASSARTAPGSRRSGKIIAGVHRPDDGRAAGSTGGESSYRSPRDALARRASRSSPRSRRSSRTAPCSRTSSSASRRSTAGVVDRRELRRRFAELVERAGIELPANAPAALAPRRRPAEGRDPAGARARRAPRRHGRADLGAHRRRVGDGCSSSSARLRERGHDDHLRLAPPRRGARPRRHRHRAPRRPARADRAGGRGDARAPRHRRCSAARSSWPFPEKAVAPERRPGRALRARALAPAGGRGRLVRHPRRRDRRARRADRQRPLRGRARDLRRRPPRQPATIEVDGRPVRIRTPRAAFAPASRCCPRTRKTQGLLMLRSIVDNVTLPHLGAVSAARRRRAGAASGARRDR